MSSDLSWRGVKEAATGRHLRACMGRGERSGLCSCGCVHGLGRASKASRNASNEQRFALARHQGGSHWQAF